MGKLILRKEQEDEIIEYVEKICEIIGYCPHAPMDIGTDLLAVIDDYTTTKIYKDIYFPIRPSKKNYLTEREEQQFSEIVKWLDDDINGFVRQTNDNDTPYIWQKSEDDYVKLTIGIYGRTVGIYLKGSHSIMKPFDKALARIKKYNKEIFEMEA
ncbi:MAG: hypothetical protein ABFD00_06500 [Chloroherpetonaceae bacterium]